MDTLFTIFKSSKTPGSRRLILNLTDEKNLKRIDKNAALS